MAEAAADDGCSNGEGNYSSDGDHAAPLMSFEILPWSGIQLAVAESNLASSGEAALGELKIGRCPREATVWSRAGGFDRDAPQRRSFCFCRVCGDSCNAVQILPVKMGQQKNKRNNTNAMK